MTAASVKGEIRAFCGLDCTQCEAFIATQNDDSAMRIETAKKWSKLYHADIRPEEINCSGCKSESDLIFRHCRVCEIRKCGQKRKEIHCAACNDYPCSKLEDFFKMAPELRKVLEKLKERIRS